MREREREANVISLTELNHMTAIRANEFFPCMTECLHLSLLLVLQQIPPY